MTSKDMPMNLKEVSKRNKYEQSKVRKKNKTMKKSKAEQTKLMEGL